MDTNRAYNQNSEDEKILCECVVLPFAYLNYVFMDYTNSGISLGLLFKETKENFERTGYKIVRCIKWRLLSDSRE